MSEGRGNELLSQAAAVSLAYRLWKCRLVEERIAKLYPEQEMRCPVHLSIGQEGVASGVCEALGREDSVMSGHRAHAHYIARGGNLPRLFAEIYGKATGCCLGRGGSMHLIDMDVNFKGSTPIVGGTIPVAVGVAWASVMRNVPGISTIFLGEGATEEGVWHESMNFAALHHLPVLFVCENNLYSVYTPLQERQPSRSLRGLAAAYGIEAHYGDGNDPVAVYSLARDAVSTIRAGNGPVFLEFSTYRWLEHCGPSFDNHIGYRSEAEFLEWQKLDPLPRFATYLEEQSLMTAEQQAEMIRTINAEVDFAVDFAKSSPLPQAILNSDNAYA